MDIVRRLSGPLYRNSLLLMANTAVTAGLGFIFWMVVARLYTEAEVGLGAAIISAMSLLALLSRLGLDVALVRFMPKADKPVDMINSAFTISALAAVIAAAIFIAGIQLWSPAFHFVRANTLFSIAFVVFTVFWALSWMMDFVFIARRRADYTVWKNTIYSILKVPLPVLLVLHFHAFGIVSSWGLAIGFALVLSVILFLPRVQNRYKPALKLNLDIMKGIWRYSLGNYFASLFGTAPVLILPVLVVNLCGAEQNAYFYVAWAVATLLFAIPVAVAQSLLVEGSHFEDELRSNVHKSFRIILLLLIPAMVSLYLLARWLLLAFGSGYSANGEALLQVLTLSGIFVGINCIYHSVLRVEHRITELIALSVFSAATVLGGSYFIMPHTGIVGIGYAWIVAQAATSTYAAIRMRPFYRRRQHQIGPVLK